MHAGEHNHSQQYVTQQHVTQQHHAEFNCTQQSSAGERYGNRIFNSAIQTASQLKALFLTKPF